jgi:UDP-glucose 4-epimerase
MQKDQHSYKALVFGGSGFLGSYVVDELVERGHDVTVFDISSPAARVTHTDKITHIRGDIMDMDAVMTAVRGHDVVYNCAGLADLNDSIGNPVDAVRLNVLGNTHILEACRQYAVTRFVYASTVYVFSQYGAVYGASKRSCELLIEQYRRLYGLDFTIIRYGSVYGARADGHNRIYRILKQALTEQKITFKGDGSEEREYIHGKDAAKLSVDILDPSFRNQSIMLTGVERFQYTQLLKMIAEILNNEVEIEFLNEEYKGHYNITPYSFTPTLGQKLVNNPSMDFGLGILECVQALHQDLFPDMHNTPSD